MASAPSPGLIFGFGLIGIGAAGVYGSITGYLPAMVAALLYPNLLTPASNAGPTPSKAAVKISKLSPTLQSELQSIVVLQPAPPSALVSAKALQAWVNQTFTETSPSRRADLVAAYQVQENLNRAASNLAPTAG